MWGETKLFALYNRIFGPSHTVYYYNLYPEVRKELTNECLAENTSPKIT